MLDPDPRRADYESRLSPGGKVTLNTPQRRTVLRSIRQHTAYRGWTLHAAHVRTNHVHLVVESEEEPETVLAQVKAYATRALNELGPRRERRWAHHGSTRYLWNPHEVDAAVQYVLEQQGVPMAVYLNPNRWPPR